MPDPSPILEVRGLRTLLGGRTGLLRRPAPQVRAVDGIDLALTEGETFGIVGESGCGKSTLGKTILGVLREAEGEIWIAGRKVSGLPIRATREARRDIQYVHQDAAASLDPWWSVGRSLREPLVIHDQEGDAEDRIDRMLAAVGLDASMKRRYPHELSGGQLRRIALARILVLSPRIVILDEPTSGLDVSVQATVLKLLRELRETLTLTYLFVSHDLSVVRLMCDRVAIMYLGRIVEQAETGALFTRPAHPYTRALLAAAPSLTPGTIDAAAAVGGEPPNPAARPSGCAFRSRCPHAAEICTRESPLAADVTPGHSVNCHRWREIQTNSGFSFT